MNEPTSHRRGDGMDGRLEILDALHKTELAAAIMALDRDAC